jgi:hypothetical protein
MRLDMSSRKATRFLDRPPKKDYAFCMNPYPLAPCALLLILGLLPPPGLPAQSALQVVVEETGGAITIKKCRGTAKELIIPGMINDMPVTAIGDGAFARKNLVSVTIPDSVTSIGAGAFANNRLDSITIGDNLVSIGAGAFAHHEIAALKLGSSLAVIGRGAFADNRLREVEIPEGFAGIEAYVFYKNRIETLLIPGSVTFIGEGAFAGNQLKAVAVGGGVTEIGEGAFYNNPLSSVTIPSSVASLGKRAFNKPRNPFAAGKGVDYVDRRGNVIYTTDDNFDAFYNSTGRRPGVYRYGEGGWSLEN